MFGNGHGLRAGELGQLISFCLDLLDRRRSAILDGAAGEEDECGEEKGEVSFHYLSLTSRTLFEG